MMPTIQQLQKNEQISSGVFSNILILFVTCTDRNGRTRIISARKAEPAEEVEYYDKNYDA